MERGNVCGVENVCQLWSKESGDWKAIVRDAWRMKIACYVMAFVAAGASVWAWVLAAMNGSAAYAVPMTVAAILGCACAWDLWWRARSSGKVAGGDVVEWLMTSAEEVPDGLLQALADSPEVPMGLKQSLGSEIAGGSKVEVRQIGRLARKHRSLAPGCAAMLRAAGLDDDARIAA